MASEETVAITLSDSVAGAWEFNVTVFDDGATEHQLECFVVRVSPTAETKAAFGEVISVTNEEQEYCIMDDDGS